MTALRRSVVLLRSARLGHRDGRRIGTAAQWNMDTDSRPDRRDTTGVLWVFFIGHWWDRGECVRSALAV